MLRVVSIVGTLLDEGEGSNSLGPVRADFPKDLIAFMAGEAQSPGGGDHKVTLAILQRRWDTLNMLNLSGRIWNMAARLRIDREE